MAFVYGSDNSETINALDGVTEGADTIHGYGGNDTIFGLGGDDLILGGAGTDTLWGDSGSDTLKGGGGADTLNGGSGTDTASYADSAAAVTILLFQDDAWGGDADGDELNSIENVTGSAHDDTLCGNDGANVLKGLDGADSFKGFGGNDTIHGGKGDDILYGMEGADTLHEDDGNDTMSGGHGDDTYFVDSASDTITEAAGQGVNDVLHASTTYALAPGVHVERMYTTDVNGTAAIDLAGNEVGQAIWGNAGINVLSGLGGSDTLVGGGGDDHLAGGAGGDMLSGGTGNDTFVFAPGHADGDAISDFAGNGDAAGDVLVFSGYGPGATFTQVDGYHWQVNYNGGASHDVITFLNGAAAVHPSDVAFV